MTITTHHAVRVEFVSERMTNSTELRRLRRSIDTLYYVALFTSIDTYDGRDDVWRSWARMGFATGIQEAPPGSARSDRLRLETYSDGKSLTFTAHSDHKNVLNTVAEVLRAVDDARSEVSSFNADDRGNLLAANDVVNKRILSPLFDATANLAADDVAALQGAVRTALGALTYPTVIACNITEDTAEG